MTCTVLEWFLYAAFEVGHPEYVAEGHRRAVVVPFHCDGLHPLLLRCRRCALTVGRGTFWHHDLLRPPGKLHL